MIFSIAFYIAVSFLKGEHDEVVEIMVYIFYGKINKVWLFCALLLL